MPNEPFFCYIMVKDSYILMIWWWWICPLCTRTTHWVGCL